MSARKTYEYREGIEAKEHFEAGMRALFQVPSDAVADKKKARKKRARISVYFSTMLPKLPIHPHREKLGFCQP
ncbi:MAG TPA: hypothetical protein VI636_17130 [Candidatus Angelobacter sp.]